MAKSSDATPNEPADKPAEAESAGTKEPVVQQRQQVQVDDAKAISSYTNFCRVTGTPEELIVDFGLNIQPVGGTNQKISVTQRIILNYYTAKRLLAALQMSIQRHEAAFGVLETDIQKRVQPAAMRQAAPK